MGCGHPKQCPTPTPRLLLGQGVGGREEATRTETGHKASPCHACGLQAGPCTLCAHSCDFCLAGVVFGGSAEGRRVIHTSYLHYTGFHPHNSCERSLLHPLLSSTWKPSQRQGGREVAGSSGGEHPTTWLLSAQRGAGPSRQMLTLTRTWLLHSYPWQNHTRPLKKHPYWHDTVCGLPVQQLPAPRAARDRRHSGPSAVSKDPQV